MEDHCQGCSDEENELCYECGYCIDCCTCGPEAWEKDNEENDRLDDAQLIPDND